MRLLVRSQISTIEHQMKSGHQTPPLFLIFLAQSFMTRTQLDLLADCLEREVSTVQ